jgi:hypothetical protein
MLLISIVLGIIPLVGIAWIVISGTITTVDGLFESLILLMIAGVFLLNVFWELPGPGFLSFLSKGKAGPKNPSSDKS